MTANSKGVPGVDSKELQRRQLLKYLAVGSGTALAGCAGGNQDAGTTTDVATTDSNQQNPSGENGGTLKVLITEGKFKTMDPLMANLVQDRQVMYNVFSGLLRLKPNLQVEKDLATTVEFTDDTTLHIELREGVKFHDGSDLTSEDVKFSLNRILNSESSTVKGEVAVINEIEVDGDYAVDLNLSAMSAPLKSNLTKDMAAGCIVPKNVVEEKGAAKFAENPVGSGPFKFANWKPGNELRLEKNTEYYKENKPYVDEVVLQPVSDTSTQLAAIQTGDAHVLNRGIHQQAKTLRANPSVNYFSKPGGNVAFLNFNHTMSVFQNRNLRRAISMGINRKGLNTTTLFGEGWPARHAIPPVFDWAYTPVKNIPYTRHNPEKAKQLIKDEGFEGFEFELLSYNEPLFADGAQVMANELRQLGLKPQVKIVDITTLVDRIVNTNFETLYAGVIGQVDPNMVYSLHHTKGVYNSGQYSNSKLDRMIEQARTLTDTQKRGELYKEIERLLAKEVPAVWTLHRPNTRVTHKSATGYTHVPSIALPLSDVRLE